MADSEHPTNPSVLYIQSLTSYTDITGVYMSLNIVKYLASENISRVWTLGRRMSRALTVGAEHLLGPPHPHILLQQAAIEDVVPRSLTDLAYFIVFPAHKGGLGSHGAR